MTLASVVTRGVEDAEGAMEQLYEEVGGLARAGAFDRIDREYLVAAPDALPTEVVVGLLMVTLEHKAQLAGRAMFLEQAYLVLCRRLDGPRCPVPAACQAFARLVGLE